MRSISICSTTRRPVRCSARSDGTEQERRTGGQIVKDDSLTEECKKCVTNHGIHDTIKSIHWHAFRMGGMRQGDYFF